MAMNSFHAGVHHAPHVAHLDDEMDVDPNGAGEHGDETEYDEEVEEEVDQLDSDTEDEAAARPVQSASPPKARQRRTAAQRVPGQTAIPFDRVRSILESEGMAETTSKEAMFMLGVAAEAFTKRLAEAGHRQAASQRRSTITYHDFAVATAQHQSFKFLRDTIPQPLSLTEALERRAAKEKELLDPTPTAAPSLAPSVAPSPLPNFTPLPTPNNSAAPSMSTNHHPSSAPAKPSRGRGRSTNGAAKSEAAPTRQSTREPKPRRRGQDPNAVQSVSAGVQPAGDAQHAKPNGTRRTSRTSRGRGVEADSVSARSRGVNGNAHYPANSARSMGSGASADYSAMNGVDDRWVPTSSGQLIGGPGVPFGGGALGLSGNPGRTIYSQQRQPNR